MGLSQGLHIKPSWGGVQCPTSPCQLPGAGCRVPEDTYGGRGTSGSRCRYPCSTCAGVGAGRHSSPRWARLQLDPPSPRGREARTAGLVVRARAPHTGVWARRAGAAPIGAERVPMCDTGRGRSCRARSLALSVGLGTLMGLGAPRSRDSVGWLPAPVAAHVAGRPSLRGPRRWSPLWRTGAACPWDTAVS